MVTSTINSYNLYHDFCCVKYLPQQQPQFSMAIFEKSHMWRRLKIEMKLVKQTLMYHEVRLTTFLSNGFGQLGAKTTLRKGFDSLL